MSTEAKEMAEKDEEISSLYHDLETALGQAVQVLAQSPLYVEKPLKEIYERLLPALVTRQYRILRNKEGQSVAYISWALVSEEVERKLEAGDDLSLSDWQSGTIGMLMDVVAKSAPANNLLVDRLKVEMFKGKSLKAMRVEGDKVEVSEVPEVTQDNIQ